VYAGFPSLWDGTMTASQRFYNASMRYGDELFARQDYCGAYAQYKNAATVQNLDDIAAKNSNEALQVCFPATATIPAVVTTVPAVATTPPVVADTPTDIPSETPTP
jgi:hypothetical protein